MKTWRRVLFCIAGMLLMAGGAAAQFTNGDFEDGGTGWTVDLPARWMNDFQMDGGNPDGHAWIMSPFGDSVGTGAIFQEFDCGDQSNQECVITFDYMLENVDAGPETGRVKVLLDGVEVFVSPPSNLIDWTTETLIITCGVHTLTAALEVDAGNHGWRASFDNFTATCEPVPVESTTWNEIKGLYR